MKFIPFNNIVLVEQLSGSEVKNRDSGIVLPDRTFGRYAKMQVIEVGSEVKHIKRGDIVLGNPVMEVIDSTNPNIGLINSHDLLAKIEE